MKKIFILITTLLLTFAAHATQFSEGKQYQVLKTQRSSVPQVTEYFSFYCPHCYNFEPVIEQLKAGISSKVKFQKYHVSFMGGSMGVSLAKAYATMGLLGIEEKMRPILFKQIQELRQAPKNDDELKQIFIDNGVDGESFEKAFNSFQVDSMQKRFDKAFTDTGLRGVPSIVVNNKYHVTPDASIKSIEDYIELINYLLTK
jgi:thiol:disulfide interchange protein DsbA